MNIRRVILIVIVIILLVLGSGYCLSNMEEGMADQDDPEIVARAAILAIETMDADKVAAYFTPIPAQGMRNRLNDIYTTYESVRIEGLAVDCTLNEGLAAKVQAVYAMVVSRDGVPNIQHCNKMVKLVKIDNKWWINEAF